MNERTFATTAAKQYDRGLRRGRQFAPVPAGTPEPQPSTAWPPENAALLERYRAWLVELGAATSVINHHRIPMAGHILGLNLKPHPQINLDSDLERAMTYVKAKKIRAAGQKNFRHSLNWFRRFLLQERGLVEIEAEPVYGHAERYQTGLPSWLLAQLEQLLHLRQANWRPSRRTVSTYQFWQKHTRLWRWLYARLDVARLTAIKRQHLYTYIDEMLAAGYAVKSVNQDLRSFQATLRFLQERDFSVPQALLSLPGLKEPDSLPRFLTDEQVCQLRDDLEERARAARTPAQIRDACLDWAVFYLLWQAGLRRGEVEDLLLEDLHLNSRRLIVRRGKGVKDRTVYLTDAAAKALKAYLAVRGPGQTDHVFLYRYKPLSKDLIYGRIKAAGKRTGVKVTPHMLRHTFATQLVNAGCRITTIQVLLGHRRLNSTMVYARVHDQTVAQDYYAAMTLIEKRLEPHLRPSPEPLLATKGHSPNRNGDAARLLVLAAALEAEPLTKSQRAALTELQQGLAALAESPEENPSSIDWIVNEPAALSQTLTPLP